MRFRHTLALFLATACQASPGHHTGFGSTPDITTAPAASTGVGSTSSSTSGTSGTSTGEDSGSVDGSTSTTTEPARDLGVVPDFGDATPVGCKGKIDFLFVISRQPNMKKRQAQLAAAFPQFINTIKAKFADFDYHIMVVTGDDGWGSDMCTDLCPTVSCKVGEPCCSWYDPQWEGEQCCDLTYPCQDLDLVTQCDRTWGAGEVFPAGPNDEANKPCPIDGDLRYLVKGQTNLTETFACIATVGASGYGLLGQALTATMKKNINDPGGCNNGFLRKDALLMVTFIANTADYGFTGSEGTPDAWAKAVLDAKHDDDRSVVMLSILLSDNKWEPIDRIGALAKMFPYHHLEDYDALDYGPAFVTATGLVESACAGFMPPG
ncbi:MAG: hypothetical protein H0T76_09455 [Nannocystis sp.]|nr:hypothetical protein [Nannocystis sp.]MBA3546695.1 hypothetical protein [Nannocystis sp.]